MNKFLRFTAMIMLIFMSQYIVGRIVKPGPVYLGSGCYMKYNSTTQTIDTYISNSKVASTGTTMAFTNITCTNLVASGTLDVTGDSTLAAVVCSGVDASGTVECDILEADTYKNEAATFTWAVASATKGTLTTGTVVDGSLQCKSLGVNTVPPDGGYDGFIAMERDATWDYGEYIFVADPGRVAIIGSSATADDRLGSYSYNGNAGDVGCYRVRATEGVFSSSVKAATYKDADSNIWATVASGSPTFVTSATFNSYIDQLEIAEPATPAANIVRRYVDSTSNDYMAKFDDGDAAVTAVTHP